MPTYDFCDICVICVTELITHLINLNYEEYSLEGSLEVPVDVFCHPCWFGHRHQLRE